MEQKQNFKEFIISLEGLEEEMKVAIINRHVTETREVIDRLNDTIAQEKGQNDLLRHAIHGEKEMVSRYKESNQKCVDECRGALLAASAMLRYQHGTHMMKHHQNEAVAAYLDAAAAGVKQHLFDPTELPF